MHVSTMTQLQFIDMVFNQVAASPRNGLPEVLAIAALEDAGFSPSKARTLIDSMVKVGLLERTGICLKVVERRSHVV